MALIIFFLLGLLSTALVSAVGWIILRRSPGEDGDRRFFLILVEIEAAILLVVTASIQFREVFGNIPIYEYTMVFVPGLLGILALIFCRIKSAAKLTAGQRGLAVGLGLWIIAAFTMIWPQPDGYGPYIAVGAVVVAVFWTLGSRSDRLVGALCLFAFACLAAMNSDSINTSLIHGAPGLQRGIFTVLGVILALGPGFSVVIAGVLISTAFHRWMDGSNAGVESSLPRRLAAARLAGAVLLLSYLAYSIHWVSIWDQTTDGIGGIMFVMEATLASVGAGILMSLASKGRRRAIGLIFAALIPVLMFQAAQSSWGNYQTITTQRAARIETAIEHFKARTGAYPAELRNMVPSELLWIPNPIIFRGYGWCYQSSSEGYRLGAVYREFFSTPISIKIYASRGQVDFGGWPCDQQLGELKARYPLPGEAGWIPVEE